jgi:ppGpp synthetase/RelA/SpoT-type nucleotidyltranferase
MIVPAALKRKHAVLEAALRSLAEEVQRTVQGYCSANEGFAYAGRIKSLESLAEKIETGRYAKWSDLDDLFACCIIVPTLKHEPAVLGFLRQAFVEIGTRSRKDAKKPPDAFRFEATRFTGALRPTKAAETSSPLYTTKFEIQVRTAFEHACAVTTHAVYKGSAIDWKARRLAAHLKAAVEQLDLLVLTFGTTSETIEEHDWPELEAKAGLAKGFSSLVNNGKIPEILAPKDWSRFAENLYALIDAGFRGKRAALTGHVSEALAVLETTLQNAGHIPHSISLLQLALGILFGERILTLPLEDYTPLVTTELTELYPELENLSVRFDLDA